MLKAALSKATAILTFGSPASTPILTLWGSLVPINGSTHRWNATSPAVRLTRTLRSPNGFHLVGYAVKMKSVDAASLWQAAPHFASLACGGLLVAVPGANVPDAVSYS